MARVSTRRADRLSALIAEIEAEAYARGQADARKELLDLLDAGTAERGVAGQTRARRARPGARKRRASGRKRAPRGSVPRFVEQALRDGSGQTPQEILARAANKMERLIKLPSIRAELGAGRRQGRYELNDGRWYLAKSDAGQTQAKQAPPTEAPREAAPGQQSPETAFEAPSAASPGSETDGGADG